MCTYICKLEKLDACIRPLFINPVKFYITKTIQALDYLPSSNQATTKITKHETIIKYTST